MDYESATWAELAAGVWVIEIIPVDRILPDHNGGIGTSIVLEAWGG